MPLSPLIRFGTSTWTYEGWQCQVYLKKYAKTTFARECLGEYCQYLYNGEPLFNQDHEGEPPAAVRQFKSAISEADAILIVTPEYNYSVPGVLKNAIDWASRPYGQSAWDGKPVGIMGASVGMLGTARAQYHLRQIFVFLNMFPLNQPEVMIANVDQKFDTDGKLTDKKTAKKIQELLQALGDWTRMLKKART